MGGLFFVSLSGLTGQSRLDGDVWIPWSSQGMTVMFFSDTISPMNKLSLVLYKNQPAVVNDRDGDKYIIKFCSQPATPSGKKAVYGEQKVREKDVVLLHEGPCTSLDAVLSFSKDGLEEKLLEAYELLMSDESTANEAVSLSDLAEYSVGSFKADQVWALYSAASGDVHFQLCQDALKNGEVRFALRSADEIDALNKKQYEKEHESRN